MKQNSSHQILLLGGKEDTMREINESEAAQEKKGALEMKRYLLTQMSRLLDATHDA